MKSIRLSSNHLPQPPFVHTAFISVTRRRLVRTPFLGRRRSCEQATGGPLQLQRLLSGGEIKRSHLEASKWCLPPLAPAPIATGGADQAGRGAPSDREHDSGTSVVHGSFYSGQDTLAEGQARRICSCIGLHWLLPPSLLFDLSVINMAT